MMNVKLPLKTVVMMVGPSGCGKSNFVNILDYAIRSKHPFATTKILSSDTIRRELLGIGNLHKHDPRMGYASEEAFAVMEKMLTSHTTFPINTDYVFLDATFLNKDNRDKFRKIAKDNQYHVVAFVFDYKDREDYFKYNGKSEAYIINSHLKRFKETTMSELYKKDFDSIYKVKNHDFTINLEDDSSYAEYHKSRLPEMGRYFVIGDIHGCYDEMVELLTRVGFAIDENGILTGNDDTLVIMLGDFIDKGPKIHEVIDFILKNKTRVKTLIGNHENFIYKFFKGQIPSLPPADIMQSFLDSSHRLNEEYVTKLNEIVENSATFLFLDNLYITHAPCKNKYLGKYDSHSMKSMRNFSYPRPAEFPDHDELTTAVEKSLAFIETDARKNFPLHIFGHVAVERAFNIKNKVFLDSGCATGGRLTGVFVYGNSSNTHFHYVASKQPQEEKSLRIFSKENKFNTETFAGLDYEDKVEIYKYAKNKVNFISGTVSPCDKNLETGDLENLREAFTYYKSKGVKQVVLQKKYMGSRANMYLFPNEIEKSYMTSRNGFVIRKLDLSPLYIKMAEKFKNEDIKLVIIDGELMPWSALGKGLISGTFGVVDEGIRSEVELLKATGFEDMLKELGVSYSASEFAKDLNIMKKEDLKKKYGEGVCRTNTAFANLSHQPLSDMENAHKIYHEQMGIFGSDGDLDFKPFAILKKVLKDETEQLFFESNNLDMFQAISDDDCCLVNLDYDKDIKEGHEFFDKVTNIEKCEGVVVKPYKVYTPGVAPFLKVRNMNYLTIIYGYDLNLEPKLSRMIKTKNVNKKMSVSIKEYQYGMKMLSIPYESISKDNTEYLNACAAMVIEEKGERSLDPRL
jgi:predicted kinase